jgi:uncharacterized protein YhaN
VRLRSLSTVRFGPLSGRTFDFEDAAFVVYGPNEAGKSTFHAAVETVFYGFDPAKRDQHPLSTWDAGQDNLHLEAELLLDDGAGVTVERQLQTAGTLRLGVPGAELEGPRERKNAPLPELQSIPRALFRAVYSLTAGDTLHYKDDVRHHVDELLLGERGLPGARPLHEVRSALEAEIRGLWKPNDVGQHAAKVLRDELREARRELREARLADDALREAQAEHTTLTEELARLRDRRARLLREQQDAAFLEQLGELHRRGDAVRPPRSAPLEGAPMADPSALRAEVERLESRLAEPRARLAREPERLSLFERQLVHRAELVEARLRDRAHQERDADELRQVHQRAKQARAAAREALTRVSRADSPDMRRFERLPLDGLRAAAHAWQEELDEAQGQRAAAPAPRAGWWSAPALAGVVVLVLVALGALPAATSVLGAALLAVTLVALARPQPARAADEPRGAPAAVDALLAELDLEPAGALRPSGLTQLADRLETVRAQLSAARRELERGSELEHALQSREEDWRLLAEQLGVEPGGVALDVLTQLERALKDARAREAVRARDEAERAQAAARVADQEPELQRARAALARVEGALHATFPELSDMGDAYEEWRRNEAEAVVVRDLERKLRADPRWRALRNDPRADGAQGGLPFEASEPERRKELRDIDDLVEELVGRKNRIEQRLEDDPGSRVARASERQRELEQELDAVREQRDRLALLERLLAEAERHHREEHQPDVLRRAGEYLARVTDGRYTRLDYPLGPAGPLHVHSTERDDLVEVAAPLSRGTLEQVYVCLRLGTLDYLDRGRERLPLVLDEALVHWDEARRRELYPVLRDVARRRQIVLFTCHAAFAEEAHALLGARVVDLGAPSGAPRARA